MLQNPFKSWIEISRSAVAANIASFRKILSPGTKLFAVVKSNAYGHGLLLFSKLAAEYGVDGFCVDSVIEGGKLRREGILKPILVVGPTFPNLLRDAEEHNLTITISNFDALAEYEQSGAHPAFHIKVDTGMHRQGFQSGESERLLARLLQTSLRKKCTGLCTHFASAKDPEDRAFTEHQYNEFIKIRDAFLRAGFTLLVHAAATGGALLDPKYHFDAVRIGIGLYGVAPSRELARIERRIEFLPALSWHGLVSEIKKLPAGSRISYDGTFTTTRDTAIAILPVGYWHGIPLKLSNAGAVIIHSLRAPILGRVCMDLIIVDVTDIPGVRRSDTATLIGDDLSAAAVAETAQSSPYELLTRLNPLIHRIVV